MREIKFRGKRLDNGEWVYGDYHRRAGGVHCIIAMEPDEQGKVCYVVNQVDPKTVGQYTGLLDKNGKEIYEVDIVSMSYASFETTVVIKFSIEYRRGLFACVGDEGVYALRDCNGVADIEVIGNIHDSPELLKP